MRLSDTGVLRLLRRAIDAQYVSSRDGIVVRLLREFTERAREAKKSTDMDAIERMGAAWQKARKAK